MQADGALYRGHFLSGFITKVSGFASDTDTNFTPLVNNGGFAALAARTDLRSFKRGQLIDCSLVRSDADLLTYREIDDAIGLPETI